MSQNVNAGKINCRFCLGNNGGNICIFVANTLKHCKRSKIHWSNKCDNQPWTIKQICKEFQKQNT